MGCKVSTWTKAASVNQQDWDATTTERERDRDWLWPEADSALLLAIIRWEVGSPARIKLIGWSGWFVSCDSPPFLYSSPSLQEQSELQSVDRRQSPWAQACKYPWDCWYVGFMYGGLTVSSVFCKHLFLSWAAVCTWLMHLFKCMFLSIDSMGAKRVKQSLSDGDIMNILTVSQLLLCEV